MDDIEIRQADWHPFKDDPEYFQIVGEFFNRCSEPTGVHLAFTFRNAAGKVVGVKELWPASVRNVEPHASYPFELTIAAYADATSMSVRILEVRRW
jgi:hypothetical protein